MKEKNSIKNLAIILTFILLFQYVSIIFPFLKSTAASYGNGSYDGVTYYYTRINNKYKIDYYVSGTVGETLKIPNTLNGYTMELLYGLFTNQHGPDKAKNVKTLEIPKSIIEINSGAFLGMDNLENIIVAEDNSSYTTIDGVLYNKDKTSLIKCPPATETITIPDTVTSVNLDGCTNLTSVTLPNSVTNVNFQGCSKLENIEIPDSVTSIFGDAFQGCSSLKSITLPNGIEIYNILNFDGCDSLETINSDKLLCEDKVVYNKDKTELIWCNRNKDNVTIPNTVSRIEYNAFNGCSNLTNINIPESVTEIDGSAFENCSNLTQINIPNNLQEIMFHLFKDCTKLSNINIPNSVTKIQHNAFNNTGLTSVIIPDSVEEIGDYAFANCTELETVKLPNSLGIIGNNTFYGCSSLENIEIPDGVTELKGESFANCTNLKTVKIPNSVKTFGYRVFENDPDVVIICEKDSKAYEYAKENNISCKVLCIVKFENEVIYNRVKEQLGANLVKEEPGKLTLTIYNSVESLDISNLELKNIDWLSNFDNLKTLNASNNHISDISVLDNLNIENLNLNNQTFEIEALKENLDMPNVLLKAKDEKYSNNESVTYTENNVQINNEQIRLLNTFGFGEENSASITVNNGALAGTVCTIKPAENILANIQMNGDILKIKAYKNETEEIATKDIDLYYMFNNTHYEPSPYSEPVKLSGNENTITIKFFNREFDPIDINISIKVTAVRRNGKIYLYANGSADRAMSYSLSGEEGPFSSYEGPIDNLDKQVIYVKVDNEEDARTIDIQDIDYDSSDIHDAYKKKENYVYNNTDRSVAVREGGTVRILSSALDSTYNVYYSYDKKNWKKYDNLVNQLSFENIAADKIYIKTEKYDHNYQTGEDEAKFTVYCFKIYDYYDEKDHQLLGAFNENDESYIFGRTTDFIKHVRVDTSSLEPKNYVAYDIIDDDIEVQKYTDGKILDITAVAQDIFILKQDGYIYKIGANYTDLQSVPIEELIPIDQEPTKFNQINGVYALDNNNKIWEMTYDGGYKYVKKDIEFENTIQKVCQVMEGDGVKPYVLYTNGTAAIINNDNPERVIGENVIDISSNNENFYAITANNLIYNGENINLFSIAGKGEIPVKINAQGSILTNKGNYYEMNIEYSDVYIDEITKSYTHETENYTWNKMDAKSIRENEINTDVLKKISSITYPDTPNKTEIEKLGDYSYRNTNDNTYYMINGTRPRQGQIENVQDNDIVITKDETKLQANKVIININVPNNKYTVRSLDNLEVSEVENGFKYVVTKNGEYVFEFEDTNGDVKTRVVHVKTIQNRKITKVPEVISLNGKIKFESDEEIEYSFDKQSWTAYDKNSEIEYTRSYIYKNT